jgi:hypothetical protein
MRNDTENIYIYCAEMSERKCPGISRDSDTERAKHAKTPPTLNFQGQEVECLTILLISPEGCCEAEEARRPLVANALCPASCTLAPDEHCTNGEKVWRSVRHRGPADYMMLDFRALVVLVSMYQSTCLRICKLLLL